MRVFVFVSVLSFVLLSGGCAERFIKTDQQISAEKSLIIIGSDELVLEAFDGEKGHRVSDFFYTSAGSHEITMSFVSRTFSSVEPSTSRFRAKAGGTVLICFLPTVAGLKQSLSGLNAFFILNPLHVDGFVDYESLARTQNENLTCKLWTAVNNGGDLAFDFVRNGARLDFRDNLGRTVLDFAVARKASPALIEAIKEKMPH